MDAFAYTEESFLPENNNGLGADSAGAVSLPASMGTFALRRAQYFNETAYLNEAKRFNETGQEASSLDAGQQLAPTNLMRNSDPVAKQKMIARNRHLVVDIDKRYTNRGVPLLNLYKEGNQGLIHALDECKAGDKFNFSSYAAQCIRQHIERAIANQNNRSGALQDIPSQRVPSQVPVVSLQSAA